MALTTSCNSKKSKSRRAIVCIVRLGCILFVKCVSKALLPQQTFSQKLHNIFNALTFVCLKNKLQCKGRIKIVVHILSKTLLKFWMFLVLGKMSKEGLTIFGAVINFINKFWARRVILLSLLFWGTKVRHRVQNGSHQTFSLYKIDPWWRLSPI